MLAPASERDSIEQEALDVTTVQEFQFHQCQEKLNISGKKLKLWSIENFDFSYSYTQYEPS